MTRYEIEQMLGIWQERLAQAHDNLEEAEAQVEFYQTELEIFEEDN